MPSILITGANRGIGLEFARQYHALGWQVVACCRNPAVSDALTQLSKTGSLTVEQLDVADLESIDRLAAHLGDISLDLLINNAGVFTDTGAPFGQFNYDNWLRNFQVNTIGPAKMVETFYPHLLRGAHRKVVCLSSQMASISAAGRDGAYSYRASKAGLNGVMATMARELVDPMIHFYLFHPGWVATDMGGAEAPVKPVESVTQMRQQIETRNPEGGALFLTYNGTELRW